MVRGRDVLCVKVGSHWRVRLQQAVQSVRLLSLTWVPAQTRAAESNTRTLGVAIGRMWLDGREGISTVRGLWSGWHVTAAGWRWTDGDAELAVAGTRDLAFELGWPARTGGRRRPPVVARHEAGRQMAAGYFSQGCFAEMTGSVAKYWVPETAAEPETNCVAVRP